MAHAIPQALTRPNGFALLRPATRPQLDSARIVTVSGTIAINLIAMGLLMMPLSLPAPVAWVDPEPGMIARPVKREPVVVEIVPVRNPVPVVTRSTPERPRTVAPADTSSVATAVISETGTELATESTHRHTGPASESSFRLDGPAPMQLEYARAPAPKYPRNALRLGLTGTVMLQVLVGIDGMPLDVTVVQSSGHRELDEAARAQVLKRWSFRPATRDGVAIQAIGMVPVQFSLQR